MKNFKFTKMEIGAIVVLILGILIIVFSVAISNAKKEIALEEAKEQASIEKQQEEELEKQKEEEKEALLLENDGFTAVNTEECYNFLNQTIAASDTSNVSESVVLNGFISEINVLQVKNNGIFILYSNEKNGSTSALLNYSITADSISLYWLDFTEDIVYKRNDILRSGVGTAEAANLVITSEDKNTLWEKVDTVEDEVISYFNLPIYDNKKINFNLLKSTYSYGSYNPSQASTEYMTKQDVFDGVTYLIYRETLSASEGYAYYLLDVNTHVLKGKLIGKDMTSARLYYFGKMDYTITYSIPEVEEDINDEIVEED